MAEPAIDVTENNKETKRHKSIKHYSSSHRILLVGEGDFSFSASLARAFGSACNMVATSFDSAGELLMKHPTAKPNLKLLKELGCIVLNDIDCHTMNEHPNLKETKFDRIVFNFPHAVLYFPESKREQINLHKDLVKGFFKSASSMLTSNGEVHVTHKTTQPYSFWGLEDLAKDVGLTLLEKSAFKKWDYPGYNQKRAYGRKCNRGFRVGECATFKFVLSVDDSELNGCQPHCAFM
ncbi:hypothetical protein AAC387_Pa07g1594 [Persea americana]